ncbi:RNA polymerase sigma factor [Algivirga pacifica]
MRKEQEQGVCHSTVFEKLFKQHSQDLHDFLYYKYGDRDNPADLVQEAFMKLWDNCHKVLPEKARGFLFTVVNNQMLNVLDRKKTALKYQHEPQQHFTNESPEYLIEETEYLEQLEGAIASLTPEQREAFLLFRIEGKKQKEIAELLGISQKAVEKRIAKAHKHLKTILVNF